MKIRQLAQWLMSRPRKQPCTTVVLHATAGSTLGGAISTLRLKGLSYHYLIEKDGAVTKCCPSSRVAYHAGKSIGPSGKNVNDYSIGISFVNRNDGVDPITTDQELVTRILIRDLKAAFPLKYVTTHWAISPGRKSDPVTMGPSVLKDFSISVGLMDWR